MNRFYQDVPRHSNTSHSGSGRQDKRQRKAALANLDRAIHFAEGVARLRLPSHLVTIARMTIKPGASYLEACEHLAAIVGEARRNGDFAAYEFDVHLTYNLAHPINPTREDAERAYGYLLSLTGGPQAAAQRIQGHMREFQRRKAEREESRT